MRKIIGPSDFRQTGRPDEWDRLGEWWVCEEYEIREGEIVARFPHPYVNRKDDVERRELNKRWRKYYPLKETPDLFLKLAYLYEQEDFSKAALDFTTRYGVLGSSSSQWSRNTERISLYSFREESRRAWLILKVYEAVLSGDGTAAEVLLSEHDLEVLDRSVPIVDESYEGLPLDWKPGPRELELERLDVASVELAWSVEESVQALCRPAVLFDQVDEHYDISTFKAGWKYRSLLGAAYLQAFWLVTSGEDLSRCEYCDRMMAIPQIHPNGRKQRNDRKYCNAACRQAHYRNKQQREV